MGVTMILLMLINQAKSALFQDTPDALEFFIQIRFQCQG